MCVCVSVCLSVCFQAASYAICLNVKSNIHGIPMGNNVFDAQIWFVQEIVMASFAVSPT